MKFILHQSKIQGLLDIKASTLWTRLMERDLFNMHFNVHQLRALSVHHETALPIKIERLSRNLGYSDLVLIMCHNYAY